MKTLLTLILSASLATASFSTPVRAAEGGETARTLMGLAALAAIGIALANASELEAKEQEDARKKKKKKEAARYQAEQQRHAHNRDDFRDDRWRNEGRIDRPRAQRILPRECLNRVWTRRGEKRLVSMNCLADNHTSPRSLPKQCIRHYRDLNRGQREVTGYDPACLRENGMVLSRY